MKELKDSTVNFIMNHGFPHYENYNYDKSSSRYYKGGLLVHNVRYADDALDSIVERGILRKYNYSNDFTWAVNLRVLADQTHKHLKDVHRMGFASIGFTLPTNTFIEKMNDSEWGIYDDILPDRIEFIDLYLGPDNIRLSDIPFLVQEYSLEEVLEVYSQKSILRDVPKYLSEEQYFKLLDWAIENSK